MPRTVHRATSAAVNTTQQSHSPRMLYGRAEAARLLSISTRSLDYLVSGKELNTRRIGNRVMFQHEELRRFCRGDHNVTTSARLKADIKPATAEEIS